MSFATEAQSFFGMIVLPQRRICDSECEIYFAILHSLRGVLTEGRYRFGRETSAYVEDIERRKDNEG